MQAASAPIDQARLFLSRVWAWPAADEPGYCNLHYTTSNINPKSKLPYWGGSAHRTIDSVIKSLSYSMRSDKVRDIYYCLSVQAEIETKVTSQGKSFQVALRNQRNAVNIKVFAIDIDFKGGNFGYDSEADATKNLIRFLKETGLPRPTIIVGSGGGMHVYWVVDRALTSAEWLPVAFSMAEATKRHNLKCDTQCTIDIARVLRVPGTFNLKRDQPRAVTIMSIMDTDYSLEAIGTPLEPYLTALPPASLLPARKALTGTSDLSSGIDTTASAPIELKSVVKECPFILGALKTGGRDLANPLWNLTTLLATFTANGRSNAHLMARNHPGYTAGSTDDLFDRKEQEKEAKALGWPSCATISANGASECQLCPHKIENKTPLHFGSRVAPKVPQAVIAGVPIANSSIPTPNLPAGYTRRSDGVILYLREDEHGQKTWIPVISYPMTNPWLQRDPWVFNFTTKSEYGREHQIAIETATFETADMKKHLQSQGMLVEGQEVKPLGKLLMSWVKNLQGMKDAVVSSHPYGWNLKNGIIMGFIYGGKSHGINGSIPSANPDPVIQYQYSPTGEREPWIAAAEMVTSQSRPELEAILASAFGSPLVRFTGHTGMMMSAYSPGSGLGKTTTMRTALAVWGNPQSALQSLTDTHNSIMNKIGQIRNIPLYWDELRSGGDGKKVVSAIFNVTQGKEKSRLNSRSQQKAPGQWQTLMVTASNETLVDIVEAHATSTTAGIYRLFEYEVRPGVLGQIDAMEAQIRVSKLNDNYGQIGLEYAEFLGKNFNRIAIEVSECGRELGAEVNAVNEERLWIGTMTCIIMGARYANELGFAKFDEDKLKRFLLNTLDRMRRVRIGSAVDMKEAFNVSNVMAKFLSDMRARHTLFTNVARTGVGKPAVGVVKVVRDASRLEGVYVRVGVEDKIIRISSSQFSKWLEENDYLRTIIVTELQNKFGATNMKGRIGSGTDFAGPSEYMIEIDLKYANDINFIDEA